MTKDVTLADLPNQLREVIEDIRRGVTIRLFEEGTAFAEIAPNRRPLETEEPIQQTGPPDVVRTTPEDMIFRRAQGVWADFAPPPPIESDIDVVALLREDRDAR